MGWLSSEEEARRREKARGAIRGGGSGGRVGGGVGELARASYASIRRTQNISEYWNHIWHYVKKIKLRSWLMKSMPCTK